MLKNSQSQHIEQNQSQKQTLSPQQLQFIKLLQLPTVALEQRIKEEIEMNPVLEEDRPEEPLQEPLDDNVRGDSDDRLEAVDEATEDDIDWEEYLKNTEYDGNSYEGGYSGGGGNAEWRDLPNPYHESLLEKLEQQVSLLNFNDDEKLIAAQILGSLNEEGYFRREIEAVVDNIAFNHGVLTDAETVEGVRKTIQRLDPPGIASRDLQDCLQVQLALMDSNSEARQHALKIVANHWSAFEKKHFKKLKQSLNIDDEALQQAFDCIRGLDPKPGGTGNAVDDTKNYIEPDFEVTYHERTDEQGNQTGEEDFEIRLTDRNVPALTISPHYKEMWENLKNKESADDKTAETKNFIKDKVESAQWFINSIRQRQNTLMRTMQTIVALQEDFFKRGEGLKPMIMKDIAERIEMDISTVSRVVNGKYVQTNFGVFELRYFFSEGIEMTDGEEVSSRVVKKAMQHIVDEEDKKNPLSDKAVAEQLREAGYKVARRTVSKYREQLHIPVARLRKEIL